MINYQSILNKLDLLYNKWELQSECEFEIDRQNVGIEWVRQHLYYAHKLMDEQDIYKDINWQEVMIDANFIWQELTYNEERMKDFTPF